MTLAFDAGSLRERELFANCAVDGVEGAEAWHDDDSEELRIVGREGKRSAEALERAMALLTPTTSGSRHRYLSGSLRRDKGFTRIDCPARRIR